MKIVLLRHFKVDYKWKFLYNSDEYARSRAGYDEAAVIKNEIRIPGSHRIFSSSMTRAIETSRFIFSREPDFADDMLREVPIRPFMKTPLRLPKFVWDVFGRVQWRLNSRHQPEPYRASKRRVNGFVDRIVREQKDAIIVCHGWVIKLLIPELLRKGFRGPSPLLIRNGVPYLYEL